ncbi:hypothetical protein SteCoe_497 [Stentor coeruleus]|uniref:Ribosomal protein S16 n=1 Tax=Stentor coeruleus TaxID=5963 RepID=A0A1R2D3V3_9CILI|nr:hypothetical protein SteCoe_497 [Stentor coeruleus]
MIYGKRLIKMPARIRFQIKGHPANRFYWLVAQSDKASVRSQPIERLGYWIPDVKRVYNDRSLILNRARLKYWLGVGAEPSEGVLRLLSHIGFLPKKPPPFGSKTLYPRPVIEDPVIPEPSKLLDIGAANSAREDYEAMVKGNEERKMKYQDNMRSQFHIRDSQPPGKEVQDYMTKYYEYLDLLKEAIPDSIENKAKLFISMLKFFESSSYDDKINPVDLANELNISKERAEKILQTYDSVQIPFTSADIDDMKVDLTSPKALPKKIKPGTKFYVPPKDPITPVPNFKDDIEQDFPLKLFDIKHPVRPTDVYGLKIVPNAVKTDMAKKKWPGYNYVSIPRKNKPF